MTNAQAERAITQLYESDTLRSELRDEEASLLLSWGETRLSELADRNLPDDQFDDLSNKFRALLVAINICVGKRKTSPSQHLPMMASISSAADAAGYALHPDDQTTFLKHQSVMSNQDAISELLGLLKPAEIVQATSQSIAEAAPEIVAPEPSPAVVENVTPQPEVNTIVEPTQPEAAAEVIAPEPPPAVVESAQPPQPEELPEQPHQPTQEE